MSLPVILRRRALRLSVGLSIIFFSIMFFGVPLAALSADLAEQYERDVDKVAASSQEQAIGKLTALLKKYRGTRQEPTLLARLAELQQQQGAILFRIAHGNAHRSAGKQTVQLAAYNKAMKGSIDTLNSLIARYPDYEEMPLAYYMRGKAQEEIGNKPAATIDYSHLVAKFPDAPETPPAYMALAEFAIAANDHPRAVALLTQVEKLPDNPHYPFALYKLAWSHFNLKNVSQSLSYMERHVAYYRQKFAAQAAEKGTVMTTDHALLENSLLDIASFYFEGYEQGDSRYSASEALAYFRKLESGKALGRMLLRFARLLRSHAHEKDLIAWKDQILMNEAERPESMEIVITVYEFQQNRRKFPELIESARDMVKLYALASKKTEFAEGFASAQKLLIETADALHGLIQKNKGADGVKNLSASLAAIYDAFTKIVEDSDPRVPKVHYNLAETLFLIGDYPGATEHYRWVVDHGKEGGKWQADPSLKAIASRYEVLKQKRLAGLEVAANAFPEKDPEIQDPFFKEWLDWVDDHAENSEKLAEKFKGEDFQFEANRALYARGSIRSATDRMRKFAERNPASKFAIPSASLVLDTYLASSDWKGLFEVARDFQKEKTWKKSEFHARLISVAADAYYKIIDGLYRESKFEDVLKEAERFTTEYKGNARFADCLNLAGKAALALDRKDIARAQFSRVIVQAPNSENSAEALLARATISEHRHDLALAAADYRAYLSSGKGTRARDIDALRKKTLFLAWLSADLSELRAALDTQSVCTEALSEECDRFRALAHLASSDKAGTEPETTAALERVKKTSGENRTVWAALALEGVKHLAFKDRLYLLRQVASGWDEADPLVKYTLLPHLSLSIPRAFQLNRLSMPQAAPLRAHERYITRRVEVIREIENAATKIVKLPWARIRAEVLNEIASLYLDFSHELAKLPPPKDLSADDIASYEDTIRKLVLPFEEKGQEMREKAFEIASRFHVEESVFQSISDPYFRENPSQSKRFRALAEKKLPNAPVSVLDVELLDRLDETLDWRLLIKNPADDSMEMGKKLRKRWAGAIQQRKWQQVAYFLQEAAQLKAENAIFPPIMGMMKAITLEVAGARGEALSELDTARRGLDPRRGALATLLLVHHAVMTCAPERVAELLKQLPSEQLSKEEALYIASLIPNS